MKFLKNLKHIFLICVVCLVLFFSTILFLSRDFLVPINYFFIYRSGAPITQAEIHANTISLEQTFWQDALYKHGNLSPSNDILIVTIDEATLNYFQNTQANLKILTLPKKHYIEFIEKAESFGIKGLAIDIIFQNKEDSEEDFVKTLEQYTNIVLAAGIPPLDEKNETLLSEQLCMDKDGKSILPDAQTAENVASCPMSPRAIYKNIAWGIIDTSPDYEKRPLFYDYSSDRRFRWKTTQSGSVTLEDFRRKNIAYTLPLMLASVSGAGEVLKNTQKNEVLNTYFGPRYSSGGIARNTYPRISLKDFLQDPEAYRELFKGKYVFMGESGTMIHDSFLSPVNNSIMDGVELHAHFLDGILNNKLLKKADASHLFFIYVVIIIGSVLLYFFLPKTLALPVAFAVLIMSIWICRYVYDMHRILIDIFPLFLAGTIFPYPTTYIYRYFIIDYQKRHIIKIFSYYLSPEIVKRIDIGTIDSSLGGEKKEVTIMFSDIVNFTNFSEHLDPKILFDIMSAYFTAMTDILLKNGGTLDKYIGDSIMAFFGAPIHMSNHAINACHTALQMRKVLLPLNAMLDKKYALSPLDFRIGIATGEVLVGNIGSTMRFNYTVLGDNVNLAARLEGIGRDYQVHILLAENTYQQIKHAFLTRELDYIGVKGKQDGVRIFELIDTKENIKKYTPYQLNIYTSYNEALKKYRAGNWSEAKKIWEKQKNDDNPSKIMAKRCESILQGTTFLDNNIYRFKTK